MGRQPPEMERDKWWDVSVPRELPYTISALPFRHETDMSMVEDEDVGPALMLDVPKWHGRKISTNSLQSISASIFSSIKGAVFGRKHSRSDSICSADTGSQGSCHNLNTTKNDSGGLRKVSTYSMANGFVPKLDVIKENKVGCLTKYRYISIEIFAGAQNEL